MVAIGLTLLASVSASILTGPRVALAMARAGQFLEVAGRLSVRGAPTIATALHVARSLILLWTAAFERILLYSGVGLAIFPMLTVGAVYVLRRRRPGLPRPFRTRGHPTAPAVDLVGTGLLTAAVFHERRSSRQSACSALPPACRYTTWGPLPAGADVPLPDPDRIPLISGRG